MKASIRFMLIILMLAEVSGCATAYTVSADSDTLKQEACREECTIPRVYSGTAMDLCVVTQDDTGQGGAIMFWDMLFSIPADTLILPYTAFMQVKDGSISNPQICSEESSPNTQR